MPLQNSPAAMIRKLAILVTTCVTLIPPLCAQDDLESNQKAVIAFELRLDKLRENPFYASKEVQELLSEWQKNVPWGMQLENIQRVSGAISVPESIDDLFQEFGVDAPELPMDIVIRIKFDNGAAADAMYAEISNSKFAKEIEVDGNTYIQPMDEATNLRFHQFDLTTIEIASESYLIKESDEIYSPGLKKAWATLPEHALRIAIDLQGRRDFVDGAVAMAKSESPPMMGGFLDLFSKANDLRLSIDLDSKALIAFAADGVDNEQAEELRKGLDGLLGMLKFTIQQNMAEENEDDAKVVRSLLNSLVATRDNAQVNIAIARPAGFEEFLTRGIARMHRAARDAETMNRFRQYALAVHNYESATREFPIGADDNISWRVRILPFLEQLELYRDMDVDEPWDSETNKPFAEKMPDIYGNNGSTTDVCWIKPERMPTSFRDIIDGTSVTIMLLQVPAGVPWTKAKDLTIDEALRLFDNLEQGQSLVAALYDGSVREIDASTDREVLRNLLDPADGNRIDR